ncbi:hypothetical protein [Nonomuraea basaltis]|uniref:hypothetical protein n=1 Tax=Nonomuraea basaltis TaxID=2495887 RepID=UPI00110C6A7C|nr:hypothetical protein [Nonomuraea basaltis]TMR88612.1 hypothetical protein EJK15_65300 [Nonomuraea basaltis]
MSNTFTPLYAELDGTYLHVEKPTDAPEGSLYLTVSGLKVGLYSDFAGSLVRVLRSLEPGRGVQTTIEPFMWFFHVVIGDQGAEFTLDRRQGRTYRVTVPADQCAVVRAAIEEARGG